MVKQFTIPCQFQGGATSPVTLYIGHPEAGHHPVHFQSDWLSTAKGGTIPQDLMDTLQKLHDLANENGADFEELCYYALISATQHGASNGVSTDDINKYADEYIKQDGNVDMKEQQNEQNNTDATSSTTAETTASANSVNSNDTSKTTETSRLNEMKDADPVSSVASAADAEQTNQTNTPADIQNKITQQHIEPTVSVAQQSTDSNSSDDVNIAPTNNNEVSSAYSDEDEDLLLMDDLSSPGVGF